MNQRFNNPSATRVIAVDKIALAADARAAGYRTAIVRMSQIVAVIGCVVLLTACADLEAVRSFSKTSAASADYKTIVADYVKSPAVCKLYNPRDAARLDKRAEERAAQKKTLEGVQTVIVEYMSALGDLAADDLPNVDKQVDGLSTALADAKIVGDSGAIDTKTTSAASTIAKVLLRAVADGWRQKQVVKIVHDTNAPLQGVIAGLKDIITNDFAADIRNERDVFADPFKGWQRAAIAANDPDGAARVAVLFLTERQQLLDARQKRIDDYVKVLDTIAKGHAELAENVNKLKDKVLIDRLKSYAKDLQTLYRAIHDAGA